MEFMAGLPDKAFDLAIVDPDFGLGDRISNGGTWAAKYKREDGNLGGKPPKEYWAEMDRHSKAPLAEGLHHTRSITYLFRKHWEAPQW